MHFFFFLSQKSLIFPDSIPKLILSFITRNYSPLDSSCCDINITTRVSRDRTSSESTKWPSCSSSRSSFPPRKQTKSLRVSHWNWRLQESYINAFSGKSLLARIDIDGDTEDLESQSNRSYDTFERCNSPDESTTTVGSSGSIRCRINPRIVSDAILGLSDGLTVPFALSAGLSALGNTKVVVLGGLAELAAGAISMGLGGYVGAKSEA